MTVALTDGPLGLEGIHIWTPGDGGAQIIMNDKSQRYGVWFKSMPGFKSLPDAVSNVQPRNNRPGESGLPSGVLGKTTPISGVLRAHTLRELRILEQQMSRAFGERDKLGTWSVLPNPTYGDDTHFWQTQARVLQYDPAEEFQNSPQSVPSPWIPNFTLGLRQLDPRWVWTDAQSLADDPTVTVDNQGSAPAEPTISVDIAGSVGSLETVTLHNDTIGKRLRFFDMPFAGTLKVNFAHRTALVYAGSPAVVTHNAKSYFDSYLSNWWDRGVPGLKPGSNDIRRVGGTGGLQVDWRHTSW